MVRGCALIDSRLDTAKICSDGRVHVDHAQLPAVLGEKKRFYTAWVKLGNTRRKHMFSAVHPITDIAKILRYVRFVPCVDGSGLARAFFTFCSIGRCSHVFALLMRLT